MNAVNRVAIAATLLLSGGPAFAADYTFNSAPAAAVDNSNFFTRLYHNYADEWGKPPVSDPNAPPTRRSTAEIAPAPADSPPYPFVDWPFGGASTIGATVPNSVDTPLQKALLPNTTAVGKALEDAHIQVYGWADVGGNVSTAKTGYNGNFPAAYSFVPNIVQLDQAVLYVERLPDTVQKDHIDWGFRISGIYGENYRYTTALGVFSNQLLLHNHFAGYDMPMVYGEVYIPYIAEGLILRFGRYISVPDIEAQLAPNNYMYSHSMTYAYDNFTNTGVIGTLKLTKNWMVQLGLSSGTETVPWNSKQISLINPVTGNPGYSGARDPGTQPSGTACVQYQTDSGWDNAYLCANAINNGTWGYNNLQWFGATYYHKFTEDLHISLESYYMYEKNVPSVTQGYANTAFAYLVNPPLEAHCAAGETQCTAKEWSLLGYVNYRLTPLDNVSFRGEFYNDENGQRTGSATRYVNFAVGEQHWFSPTVELRPEIAWYHSLDAAAFDNLTKHEVTIASMDLTWHF
jgi:hypothetical protein